MVSAETRSVIDRAKRLYANQLRTDLEANHMDRFVAIEQESGDYFLGDTFDEAVKAARKKTRPGFPTPSGSVTVRHFTSEPSKYDRICRR